MSSIETPGPRPRPRPWSAASAGVSISLCKTKKIAADDVFPIAVGSVVKEAERAAGAT